MDLKTRHNISPARAQVVNLRFRNPYEASSLADEVVAHLGMVEGMRFRQEVHHAFSDKEALPIKARMPRDELPLFARTLTDSIVEFSPVARQRLDPAQADEREVAFQQQAAEKVRYASRALAIIAVFESRV
jgi:hypothetical protein